MYFQNVFTSDYIGVLVLGDRQYNLNFRCPRNSGRGDEAVWSWNSSPFNLSGVDESGDNANVLNIYFSTSDSGYLAWSLISVTLNTGIANASAATAHEIVAVLNDNAEFNSWFRAVEDNGKIKISQKKPVLNVRFFVENGQAESVFSFNQRAGIAELPEYFARHVIGSEFSDSVQILKVLDTSNDVHYALIEAAGFDPDAPKADWELLEGKSGLFQFTNVSITDIEDGSIKTEIIYHAGAVVGDFCKKVITELDADDVILRKFELPYVLTEDDLISPP